MFAGHFEILEIKPTKDLDAIKFAYKKVANKYHPDKNPQNLKWAEEKFKLVCEAYRQLLDSLENIQFKNELLNSCFYDPSLHREYEVNIPNYWDTIKESPDPEDKIKLMVRELEQENKASALTLFLKLEEEMTGVSPLCLLGSQDYFDACFLLGESFESVGNYEKCVEFYSIYLKHIRIQLHRRSFSEELKQKVIKIYQSKLCKTGTVEGTIKKYEELLNNVILQNKEKAKIYKDMAKYLAKANAGSEKIETYVKTALELDPKIKGLNKIATTSNQQ